MYVEIPGERVGGWGFIVSIPMGLEFLFREVFNYQMPFCRQPRGVQYQMVLNPTLIIHLFARELH